MNSLFESDRYQAGAFGEDPEGEAVKSDDADNCLVDGPFNDAADGDHVFDDDAEDPGSDALASPRDGALKVPSEQFISATTGAAEGPAASTDSGFCPCCGQPLSVTSGHRDTVSGIDDRAAESARTEAVTEDVIGRDTRAAVDARTWPYVAVCRIRSYFDSSSTYYVGTGTLVAKRMVATAGHNLLRNGRRPRRVVVEFGWQNGRSVLAFSLGRRESFRVCEDYRGGRPLPEQAAVDYGAIILPRAVTEFSKLKAATNELVLEPLRVSVEVPGFPKDRGNCAQLYSSSDSFSGYSASGSYMGYRVDTEGGQSGAPIIYWVRNRNGKREPIVVGIHSKTDGTSNYGRSMRGRALRDFNAWNP